MVDPLPEPRQPESRRAALQRPFKFISDMLQAATAEANSNSGTKISRRHFMKTTAMAGAVATMLPNVSMQAMTQEAAPAVIATGMRDAIQSEVNTICFYLSEMIQRRCFETCSPNTKILWPAAESEDLLERYIARATKQGPDFAAQVLAGVESRQAYDGTHYHNNRYALHRYKQRGLYHKINNLRAPEYTPDISDEAFERIVTDTEKESLQFVREYFAKSLGTETRAQQEAGFSPLGFAVDACNIGINWDPVKKHLFLARPELDDLFAKHALAWDENDEMAASADMSDHQKITMRQELMKQVFELIRAQHPKAVNRTLRHSATGIIIHHPPEALLAALHIDPDVALRSGSLANAR